jgi:type II secretory pathway component PulF
VDTSIKSLKELGSRYMRQHYAIMEERLAAGSDEGTAIATGLFTERTAMNLRIYANTQSFQEAMGLLGLRAIDDVERITASRSSFFSLLVFVGIAFFVGFIIATMFSAGDSFTPNS